tara:strand:- start:1463 stop:1795 length:333 start_codon:yes stop_codon:yes gene_type:complete
MTTNVYLEELEKDGIWMEADVNVRFDVNGQVEEVEIVEVLEWDDISLQRGKRTEEAQPLTKYGKDIEHFIIGKTHEYIGNHLDYFPTERECQEFYREEHELHKLDIERGK